MTGSRDNQAAIEVRECARTLAHQHALMIYKTKCMVKSTF